MISILIDPAKIKAAARVLFEKDDRFGTGEDMPSLAVYEAAVTTWLENAAGSLLAEPEYYAYGPHRIMGSDDWEKALAHAEHWHNHPLLTPGVPAVRLCIDPDCCENAAPNRDHPEERNSGADLSKPDSTFANGITVAEDIERR